MKHDSDAKDILLKQAAEAFREIRLKTANWDHYEKAKKVLAELMMKGY